jgi:Rha family phage regulatory protein
MAAEMLPATLNLEQIDGRVWTTSLVVAEKFGKRHDTVLRAIRELECSPEFTARNFAGSEYVDSTGRGLPMFRMTRDGFTFLAMGFTGREAAVWKERFIEAFNAIEGRVRAVVAQDTEWIRGMMERSQQLETLLVSSMQATRLDVGGIKAQVEQVADEQKKQSADIYDIKSRLRLRANPSRATKEALHFAMARRGWRCPCCEQQTSPENCEIDHFFDVGRANVGNLWMICKAPCHADITAGRLQRHDVRSSFDAFQEFARRTDPQRALDFSAR